MRIHRRGAAFLRELLSHPKPCLQGVLTAIGPLVPHDTHEGDLMAIAARVFYVATAGGSRPIDKKALKDSGLINDAVQLFKHGADGTVFSVRDARVVTKLFKSSFACSELTGPQLTTDLQSLKELLGGKAACRILQVLKTFSDEAEAGPSHFLLLEEFALFCWAMVDSGSAASIRFLFAVANVAEDGLFSASDLAGLGVDMVPEEFLKVARKKLGAAMVERGGKCGLPLEAFLAEGKEGEAVVVLKAALCPRSLKHYKLGTNHNVWAQQYKEELAALPVSFKREPMPPPPSKPITAPGSLHATREPVCPPAPAPTEVKQEASPAVEPVAEGGAAVAAEAMGEPAVEDTAVVDSLAPSIHPPKAPAAADVKRESAPVEAAPQPVLVAAKEKEAAVAAARMAPSAAGCVVGEGEGAAQPVAAPAKEEAAVVKEEDGLQEAATQPAVLPGPEEEEEEVAAVAAKLPVVVQPHKEKEVEDAPQEAAAAEAQPAVIKEEVVGAAARMAPSAAGCVVGEGPREAAASPSSPSAARPNLPGSNQGGIHKGFVPNGCPPRSNGSRPSGRGGRSNGGGRRSKRAPPMPTGPQWVWAAPNDSVAGHCVMPNGSIYPVYWDELQAHWAAEEERAAAAYHYQQQLAWEAEQQQAAATAAAAYHEQQQWVAAQQQQYGGAQGACFCFECQAPAQQQHQAAAPYYGQWQAARQQQGYYYQGW